MTCACLRLVWQLCTRRVRGHLRGLGADRRLAWPVGPVNLTFTPFLYAYRTMTYDKALQYIGYRNYTTEQTTVETLSSYSLLVVVHLHIDSIFKVYKYCYNCTTTVLHKFSTLQFYLQLYPTTLAPETRYDAKNFFFHFSLSCAYYAVF